MPALTFAFDVSGLVPALPKGLLWFALGAIALQTVPMALLLLRRRAPVTTPLGADVDRMDPRAFQELLDLWFSRQGYRQEPGGSADAAVLLREGVRTALLVRRGRRPAGRGIVADAHAAMARLGCSRAIVIHTGGFATGVRTRVASSPVELWDRERLTRELWNAVRPVAPDPAPPRPAGVPVCVVCGDPLSDAEARHCRERPERYGGRVACTRHREHLGRAA